MSAASAFALDFVPRWLRAAHDPAGGLFERLDLSGRPVDPDEPKTTLVHARTAFALAHLALDTGSAQLLDAACRIADFLDVHLRDPDGGYRESTRSPLRRSYDQSFALLALVTLARAAPEAVPAGRIEELTAFVDRTLTDPADGSLFTDDAMARQGPAPGDIRSHNPHMHMLEAYLEAFDATGSRHWLERAAALIELARRHFIDPATGAVREFVAFDLSPLPGAAGERREPGHQYEWSWLLHRFADRGGDGSVRADAARMLLFVERHGVRRSGPLHGTPFDAVDAAGAVQEDTHLLWPLTEAGKSNAALAIHTGSDSYRAAARRLEAIAFGRFFDPAGLPVFANQLDANGTVRWPETLSRIVYHLALFATEGRRAGLWTHVAAADGAPADPASIPEEETR